MEINYAGDDPADLYENITPVAPGQYITEGIVPRIPHREDHPDTLALNEFVSWLFEQAAEWRRDTAECVAIGNIPQAETKIAGVLALSLAQGKLRELADKYHPDEAESPTGAGSGPHTGPTAEVMNGEVRPGDRVAYSTRAGSMHDMTIGTVEAVSVSPHPWNGGFTPALKVSPELWSGYRVGSEHGTGTPRIVTLTTLDRVVKL
jgi:hypothetical protein